MFALSYLNRNGTTHYTVAPDATSSYEARAAVSARRDCDMVLTCSKVPDDKAAEFTRLYATDRQAAMNLVFPDK